MIVDSDFLHGAGVPRFCKEFIRTTDDSAIAVGVVSTQEKKDGKPYRIPFAGHTIKDTNFQYTVHEREETAVAFRL